MQPTNNEGKSAFAKRFIRTLKNKIDKHMTAISKNVYFDVLNDTVDEYKNTYHRTIKMKPIDVKSDSFAEYNKESTQKGYKFKVGDYVRILKYKNIFTEGYSPNSSEEVFLIKKIKNTVQYISYIKICN